MFENVKFDLNLLRLSDHGSTFLWSQRCNRYDVDTIFTLIGGIAEPYNDGVEDRRGATV